MRRRARTAFSVVAAATAFLLAVSGCSSKTPDETDSANQTPEANAAVGKVFAASNTKGGTLRMANAGEWDSLDPGDMYYGYALDFVRLYGRALVMFASAPGDAGTKLVPDLAESLGKPSDGAKTWTYTLRSGIKYEDGTPVTSKDVKYAVERSLDKETFPNGPTYFNDFLDLQGYTSPYKDSDPNKLGLKAIETPDDRTIVFKLKQPFSSFDYFVMLPGTVPVPAAKDTGTKYKEHVIATGPYKFESYESGKKFSLVRNDKWDPATDPNRKALPDRVEVSVNVNADDIDNRLISGDLDIDVGGTGVQAATQAKVLADPNLKKNTDNAKLARLWYTSINPNVAPLDNVHCRKAVLYAADHEGYQRAFGGAVGGDIATTLTPPQIPGAPKTDPYKFMDHKNGDADAAKKELAECGKPTGFETNISYRAERPKEKATAESLQQALDKVGIKLTLKPFPQGDYFKLYAGKPSYAKANNLGLMQNGWGADWTDGFGFLQQMIDSRVIRETGGANNMSVRIPEVDGMIDKALGTTDTAARDAIWGDADKRVMEEAVILPGVWAKVLHYRAPTLTNVYINDGLGGYYDYASIGVKKK